jgi:uncharacterized protein with HEPN domain
MDEKNVRIVTKIISYAEKIIDYCKGIDETSFLTDIKLVEACVFNLIQIGELTRNIDENFIMMHNDIAWNKMRGLRNRIVHDFMIMKE